MEKVKLMLLDWLAKDDPKCSRCNGKGVIQVRCEVCKGQGEVLAYNDGRREPLI